MRTIEESNSLLKPGEFIFINNNAVDVPKARDFTAILLTHLKAASSRISLRFRQSLPGDLSRDLDFSLVGFTGAELLCILNLESSSFQ